MKPSAKRAYCVGLRGLNADFRGRWPALSAGGLRPHQGVLAGGVRAFWGPYAAWQRCGGLAVAGWLTSGKRAVGLP